MNPAVVVEGDFFLSGEIRALLEEMGLEVNLVASCEEAFRAAEGHAFSVAVLDPHSGDEAEPRLAEKLREKNPNIPIVVLSSDSSDKTGDAGPFKGATHLPKPFRIHQLRTIVLGALGFADTDQPGTTLKSD